MVAASPEVTALNGTKWHRLGPDEALARLDSSRAGLSAAEAVRRLAAYGPNRVKEATRRGPWAILTDQLTDLMILILLAAAVIAWWMGDTTDTVMILVIVGLNAALGFSQEYRAERALAALKKLEQPLVIVRRDGQWRQRPSKDLVPGDIIALEEGQRVPADGRLIETVRMQVNESQLTGEATPVSKEVDAIPADEIPLGDRVNLVFMGTTVLAGHGQAVVTGTGMESELGRIARLLQSVDEQQTPLQRRLAALGTWLAGAALAVTAVIFLAGLLRGESLNVMLLTAISLAVAAIPEGLPAVVTIVLAVGAQNMIRRHALIRKLPAVETLGSVTTICSDKTGTLTQNLMTVERLVIGGRDGDRLITLNGNGYAPEGVFAEDGRAIDPAGDPAIRRLLEAAALCSNAVLQHHDGATDGAQSGTWTVLGDPTEGALLTAGAKAGLWKEQLETDHPRIAEVPFDSTRKLMTTLHHDPQGGVAVFTKGSIEEVLARSTTVADGGREAPLTAGRREALLAINQTLASKGFRILACAARRLPSEPPPDSLPAIERDLQFLGLIGMIDPPRPEAKAAVARCRQAGIRPLMMTGDHRVTAEAIADALGIHEPGRSVLTGEELETMSVEALADRCGTVSVYARLSPEQKVKIVQALVRRGEIVAMTGDGVNDAPALRLAAIGVAMGRSGTDVAREAADLILMDDNFATIVSAVEGGRRIYDNIRKFTRYMLSTNSGEILTMLFAILFGLPLPLLPIQILWMNLVTDGLPALALGVEPAERDLMRRPPRPPKESLFAGGLGWHVCWVGVLMGALSIGLFAWALSASDLVHARTMAFFTLTVLQMSNVLAVRSERNPLWRIGLFSNPQLVGAVILTVMLQAVITYSPALQAVFHTTALTAPELLLCLLAAVTVFSAVELEKWWRRTDRDGSHPRFHVEKT
jgi:P-type Ca2+ transporter type 2C